MTLPGRTTALRRFVVLSAARTGSNWFCGLLNSHRQVLCHHELFHPEETWYAHGYRDGEMGLAWTPEQRDAAPRAYLEEVWSRAFGCEAVGFKILHDQAPALRDALVRDPSIKKIVLERRNVLRAFVSRVRAEATGAWSGSSYDGLQVEVNLEVLRRYLHRYQSAYDGIRGALVDTGQDWIRVHYEDLSSRRELEDVLRFLEIDADGSTLDSFTRRQSHDRLEEILTNFDEVRRELAGTAWEAMLVE